ncbi:hypothetical protein ACVNIS_10400 [Sphaerotilaceae bacterium SBD11-9]
MAIALSSEITLRACSAAGDVARSEVVLQGRPSGTEVSGRVLEAALNVDRRWLLFVTDDVPDEEMLSIHLLDSEGRLLDSATLGGPYSTGNFKNLQLQQPATARFRFIDGAEWSVHVLPAPRLSLPWWPDAKGVWRGKALRRHFVVSRQP